jgi:hypothetical protein
MGVAPRRAEVGRTTLFDNSPDSINRNSAACFPRRWRGGDTPSPRHRNAFAPLTEPDLARRPR